jgi:cell division transport system permease protein
MRSIKLGMLGAGLAIIALIGVAIRREQLSWLRNFDNKILIAAVLLAVLGLVFWSLC